MFSFSKTDPTDDIKEGAYFAVFAFAGFLFGRAVLRPLLRGMFG